MNIKDRRKKENKVAKGYGLCTACENGPHGADCPKKNKCKHWTFDGCDEWKMKSK